MWKLEKAGREAPPPVSLRLPPWLSWTYLQSSPHDSSSFLVKPISASEHEDYTVWAEADSIPLFAEVAATENRSETTR